MKEANNINTSLLTLGRCIAALRHNQNNKYANKRARRSCVDLRGPHRVLYGSLLIKYKYKICFHELFDKDLTFPGDSAGHAPLRWCPSGTVN